MNAQQIQTTQEGIESALTTTETTTPKQFPYPVIGVPEITETTEIEPVTAPGSTTTTTEEQRAIEAATVDAMATQTLPTTRLPEVCDTVLYTLRDGPSKGEDRPATITRVHGSSMSVGLFVMLYPYDYPSDHAASISGNLRLPSVPWSANKAHGAWRWKAQKA
jgi:hypothetical protein